MSIRDWPCCMCPADNIQEARVACDNKCDFFLVFEDRRGWTYFVRSGLGKNQFKMFYLKPGKTSGHACRNLPWRETFAKAQEDLNALAIRKGWRVVKGAKSLV